MPKLKARAKAPPQPHMGLTTKQRVKKYIPFYIMFIPLLACMIVFAYLPMFGIFYAFTDYSPFRPATFVGLKNFQTLFSQPAFWQAFFNTLQISTTKLIFSTLGSIILALLMDELRKGWLDRLGMDIPKTYDEFINMLTRFQQEIPECTVPYTAPGLSSAQAMPEFFQGAVPNFVKVDGQWVDGMQQDNMLSAMQRMQDAYAAGLIDMEVVTNTTSACRDHGTRLCQQPLRDQAPAGYLPHDPRHRQPVCDGHPAAQR